MATDDCADTKAARLPRVPSALRDENSVAIGSTAPVAYALRKSRALRLTAARYETPVLIAIMRSMGASARIRRSSLSVISGSSCFRHRYTFSKVFSRMCGH